MPTARRAAARTFIALCCLVGLLATLGAAPADAASSGSELERDFHALVNVERAKQGLGALARRSDIVEVARDHSARMASQWRLHHNPDFSTQIAGWSRVAENVGYGPSVDAIHDALMRSEGHRRNILDDTVTEVGIGVAVKDGRVWVTQNFRRPKDTVSLAAPSSTTFGDVSSTNVHAGAIATVSAEGIARGCATARFCPRDPVTRGQFAQMLVTALDLPDADRAHFEDTSGSTAAAADALAEAGLASGCTTQRFCPDQRLSRAQLSTLMAGALELGPAPAPFGDVSGMHASAIGALHDAGIVNGCTSSRFCPDDPITREQVASMLASRFA